MVRKRSEKESGVKSQEEKGQFLEGSNEFNAVVECFSIDLLADARLTHAVFGPGSGGSWEKKRSMSV